jgi:hypothetical protein
VENGFVGCAQRSKNARMPLTGAFKIYGLAFEISQLRFPDKHPRDVLRLSNAS